MFEVHCGDDFHFSGQAYTCSLYIETESGCFPSDDWIDFPQAVLDWWIQELKSVMLGSERYTYVFRFMDGPYSVYCEKEKEQLLLSFFRYDTKVCPDRWTSIREMRAGILSALKTLLSRLYLNGYAECVSAVSEMIKDLQTVSAS